MKYSGSVLDFTEERNEALMGAYRAVIGSREVLSLAEISERIVNRPCSRFWVSEGRAAVVISEMLKGNPILYTMRETKKCFKRFIGELFRCVKNIQRPAWLSWLRRLSILLRLNFICARDAQWK